MKCIICGKAAVVDALCKQCYIEKNPLISTYKEFTLLCCVECQRYNFGNSWRQVDDLDKEIIALVQKNAKMAPHAGKVLFYVSPNIPEHKKNPGIKVSCSADVTLEKEVGTTLRDTYTFPFTLTYSYCTTCGKKGTKYFEGILQFRGQGKLFDDAIDALLKEVEARKDKGLFINKTEQVTGGFDFYLTSQKYLQQVGQLLHKKFGGVMKVSEQLFSRDSETSRDLFRVNVFIKLPDFAPRDILLINGVYVQVTQIIDKKIVGYNLKTWKKVSSLYDKYEVIAKSDSFHGVQVVQKRPKLVVLHPETYQNVVVANPKEINHKEVMVTEIENNIYLVD